MNKTPLSKLSLTGALFFFLSPYFVLAQNTSLELIPGHQGWLNTFALSPSNKYLVTAGTDDQLIVWDYSNGKQIRVIKEQPEVTTMAISFDDRYLLSGDKTGRVTKWDLSTGKKLFDFFPHGEKLKIPEQEVEPNLREVSIESSKQSFFDKNYIKPSDKTRHFPLSSNMVLTISRDNQFILSGGQSGLVKIWNATNGQLVKSFNGHTHPIFFINLSADNKRLISQDEDGQVLVWDAINGQQLAHFEAWAINQNSPGFFYYKTSIDTLVKYDFNALKVVQRFRLPKKTNTCWLSADEKQLWASKDSTFLFDLAQGSVLNQFPSLPYRSQISLDNKNRHVYTSENYKQVLIFDPFSKKITHQFGAFTPNVTQVKLSKSDKHLILNDGEAWATLIPLGTNKEPQLKHISLNDPVVRHLLELSPDDAKLVSASAQGDVYVHDLADNSKIVQAKIGAFDALTGLDFTPEGNAIILSEYSTGLNFLNLQDLSKKLEYRTAEIKDYQMLTPYIFNLIQSAPNQKTLLFNSTRGGYGNFYQLNTQGITAENKGSYKIVGKYKLPDVTNRLVKIQLSKDSTKMIAIDELNNAGIYETKAGGKKLLNVPRSLLMTWLGSEEKMVLYHSYKQIVIYDLNTQQEISKYELPYAPIALTANSDGRFLFLITPEQKLEVRNSTNGDLLFTLTWQAGKNNYLLQTPQNTYQTNINSASQIINAGTQLPLGWKSFSLSKMFNGSLWQNFTKTLTQNAPISLNNPPNNTSATKTPPAQKKLTLNLGHYHPIQHLSFQNKDELILSVDAGGHAKTWAFAQGKELMNTFSSDLKYAKQFDQTRNPLVLKYGFSDWRWTLHLLTGDIVAQANVHDEKTNSNNLSSANKNDAIAQSKDGRRYAKTLPDGTLEIRQTNTNNLLASKRFVGAPAIVALDSLGKKAAVAIQNTIWIWDIQNNTAPKVLANFYSGKQGAHDQKVFNVLPSGQVVFSQEGNTDFTLYKVIDLKMGTQKYSSFPAKNTFTQQNAFRFNYHNKQIIDIARGEYYHFPVDILGISSFFATQNRDKFGVVDNEKQNFYLWDVQREVVLYNVKQWEPIKRVEVDKLDSLVALISQSTVQIIGLKSGKQKSIIPLSLASDDPVWVEFSTQPGVLMVNTGPQQMTIWDATNNKLVRKIQTAEPFYRIFGFSPEEQLVYTQSDVEIKVFDFTGNLLYKKDFPSDLIAEYYPEQNRIIAATEPESIYAFNASSLVLEESLYFGKNEQWVKTDKNHNYQTSPNATTYASGGNKAEFSLTGHQFVPALLKPNEPTKNIATPTPTTSAFALLNLLWSKQLKKSASSDSLATLRVSSAPAGVFIKSHFIPNSQNIALQDFLGDITIVENSTGRLLKTLSSSHDQQVLSVVSSNGAYLVSVESDNRIKLWNLKTLKLLKTVQLDYTTISALAIDPEYSKLAVGTINGMIHFFALPTLEPLKEINAFSTKITHLALSVKGEYAAGSDLNSKVLLINLKQADFTSSYDLGAQNQVNGLAFHPSSSLLLCSGSMKNYLINCVKLSSEMIFVSRKSSFHNYQQLWTENPKSPYAIYPNTAAFFNPRNLNEIYFSQKDLLDKSYYLFDYVQKQIKDTFKLVDIIHDIDPSRQVALIDNGFQLLDLNTKKIDYRKENNHLVQNFEIINQKIYYKLPTSQDVYAIDVSNSKTEVYEGGFERGAITSLADKIHLVGEFSWPWELGKKLLGQKDFSWKYPEHTPVAVCANGKYLALVKGSDSILVYSTLQDKVIHRIREATDLVDLYISNTGNHLALFHRRRGDLKIMDFKNKAQIFEEVSSHPSLMYFSPDGKFFSFYNAKSKKVFDLRNFKIVGTFKSNPSIYTHFASHQNPRYAILGAFETYWANQLWDIEKGVKIGDFYFWKPENEEPYWLFVAPDGRYDGSTEGLKQLYTVDEKNQKSVDIQLANNPKYQPGLLAKLIK